MLPWSPPHRTSARSRSGITTGTILLAVVSLLGLATGLGVLQRLSDEDAVGAVTAPMPIPATIVYGPTVFDIPTGTSATHVEQFQITYQQGARYRVLVDNGDAGTLEVDSAALVLNGTEILSSDGPLPGGITEIDVFGLTASNDVVLDLWGATGTQVTLTIEELELPTTTIFGPEEIVRTPGGTTQESHSFDLPDDVKPPYGLHLNNGYPDSTNLATVGSVELNGVEIFSSSDLSTSTYYLEDELPLLDSANVLDLSIGSSTGKRYEVYVTGVVNDTTPPVVTITAPVDESVTSDDSVTVTGTAVDAYAVTVDVNGVAAQVVDDSLFSAIIALPSEGANAITATATDLSENEGTAAISVTRDQTPPVLIVTAPTDQLVTDTSPTSLTGSATDANGADVNVNGTPVATDSTGAFADSVALTEGSNVLTLTATDPGGNQTVEVRNVTLDTGAPALTVTAPTDSLITDQATLTVTGSVTDATAVTVDANGVPLPVDGAGQFSGDITLSEGANIVTVTATDAAQNTSQVARIVTLDTQAPVLTVTSPADPTTTTADSIDVTGTVTDATEVTLTLNSVELALDGSGAFSTKIALALGANTLAFLAVDEATNQSVDTVTVTRDVVLPPDPETVASPITPNVASTIGSATAFLYEGTDPIQTGVAPDTIDPVRVAVLKGRVLDRAGQPVSGVTVSVLDHPELGQTLTRADGEYDLAVNGGGLLNVRFQKSGYPEVQRRSDLPWQDYVVLDDVVMTPLDTAVTTIDFTDPIEIAQGTPQTDADGTRQATLMFRQGTVATMTLPNGTVDTLSSVSVRATEYTVGDDGPEAMPAALPLATAYTYAVELSVDEAIAAGAERVDFDQPVSFYLENFLGMPVGYRIPVGYFDRKQGEWIAEQDGWIIEVVDIDSLGVASLNIDTIAGAEHPDTVFNRIGIDADELEAIGSQYSVGDELWHGRANHFSPVDYNFAQRLVDGFNLVWEDLPDPKVPDWLAPDDPTTCDGSIIKVESSCLDERIPIVGTPYSLNYSSLRVPGRASSFRLDIPVFGDSIPGQVTSAKLEVMVAGRRWGYEFFPDSAITHSFLWDGLDAYGRLLFGQQPIRTEITYLFEPEILQVSANLGFGGRFGRPGGGGGAIASLISTREEPGVTIEWEGRIGTRSLDRSLAGWSLDVHHSYDPIASRLYLGDGTNRSAASTVNVVGTIAGTGEGCCGPISGEPAIETPFDTPFDVATMADGSVLVMQPGLVRRIDPDGIVRPFAGGGANSSPDSVPATQASILADGMAMGPDGSLWIVGSSSNHELYRVWPDGIIEEFGGGPFGDGYDIRSDSVGFAYLMDVAVGPDGSVYVLHGWDSTFNCLSGVCRRVRRIGPEGIIQTIAGTGAEGTSGDGGPATQATFYRPNSLAVGPNGNVYVGDRNLIRRIRPDGIIERVAGTGSHAYTGDGGLALDAAIEVRPSSLVVGQDGSVYFSQWEGAVRVVTPQGIIHTVAGTGVGGYSGDGGRALAAKFSQPMGLTVGPDGGLLIADRLNYRVRRIGSPLPGFDGGGHLIASDDGSAVYQFGLSGQHIQTLSALTGATLYSFQYDSLNSLIGITDGNGLETTIARDGNGDPTSITGPFGQQTTLGLDANGYLASVTNPASEVHSLVTDSLGLLEEFITPASDTTRLTYDPEGRLTQHVDAAGRVTTLTRAASENFLQVVFERGTRTSVYRIETDAATGAITRTVTDPAGNTSQTVEALDGVTTGTTPDGTTRSSTEGPDLRFGIQAPLVTDATLGLPSSLTSSLFGGRRVELTDTLNPLSLVSAVDSVVLNGRKYRSSYDAATRTLTTTTPQGRQTVSVLDSLERLVSHEVAGLDSVAFGYDAQGLLTQALQGARAWTFDYDASGRLQAATDPLSRTDSLFYDDADRVTRQVLADGDSIVYGYDASGNLTSLAPPGRPAHAFSYNAVGLDSIYDPPDVTGLAEDRTFYTYNTNRELIEILRPDSATIDFAYDSAGRVDAVTIPRGTLDYAYNDSTGQLTAITAPGSDSLTFGYDGVLPTSETWGGTVSGTVAFGYDADLRLSGLAVNGDTIAYGYDQDGLLTSAGALTLVRDSLNGLLAETALDSVTTRTAYNAFGEPAADSAWVGSTLVLARTYSRDDLGRITEVVDFADSVTTVWGYGYDVVGRLETVTQDSVAFASYGYDANGNRLSRTSGAGTEVGVYDAQDRLTSYDGATYSYTPAGELAEKVQGADTTRYDYDALGNLIEVELPDGTLLEYLIDGRNRRVGRKVDGTLVQGWLYGDQLNPVAELDSTGAVVSRFVYGSKANVPDYIVRGSDTLRVISDHLGSVRMVVDASTGVVAQRLSYDAWGRVLEDTSPGVQPFGFAGGIWDSATGLVRFGARDYDALTGRWTAKDPVLFQAQSTNLYAYLLGDPVNFLDPAGASIWSAASSFGIGVASGFAGAVVTGATLTALGAASPILAAGGLVALAGYGGWQLGIAGQRILGGYDPWTRCELTAEERIDETAQLLGAVAGGGVLSGPRGPLFGRGRYRNGSPGLFNRGNSRVGWSWDASVGRNMWGPHGGVPGTNTHWHYTPIPGPAGPGW